MSTKWSSEYVVAEHKDLQAFYFPYLLIPGKNLIFFIFHLGKHYGS